MENKKPDEKTINHKCNNPGCNQPAKLRCPNCIKLNIRSESYFCGKECFQSYWPEHKKIHDECEPLEDYFSYTGPLRKYNITQKRTVPAYIQKPDYADHPQGISFCEELFNKDNNIPVYTENDIEEIRTSCKLGRLVLDTAHKAVAVGVTTDELDQIVHETCIENDCYPSPLNYYNFPKSVCTSVNEVICHGIPDRRPLKNGDIVNLDITVYHHGYHGDLNETYLVGTVDKKAKHLVKSTYNAMMKGIEICKPGVKFSQIGDVINDYIDQENYSVVRSYTGHGIGKLFHTNPSIYHYRKNKAIGIMKPGNIFTIEPMINEGSYKDVTWPDNWTAVTADGKRSAQFEHTILVTEDGYEILTARNQNSPVLEALVEKKKKKK